MSIEKAKVALQAVRDGVSAMEVLEAFSEKDLALASFEMLRGAKDFDATLAFFQSLGLVSSVPVNREAPAA